MSSVIILHQICEPLEEVEVIDNNFFWQRSNLLWP